MSRTVDLSDILTYELGPVPLSLAKPNGNMNKTVKSKLMQELEVDSSVNDTSTTGNKSSCFIIDLMALVQNAVTQNSILFGDLAEGLSQTVTNAFRYANTVVICPDRFDVQESIKCFERLHQRKAFVPERNIMHENQTLPCNFKEFLINLKNKCNFVTFLSDFWTSFSGHRLAESQKLLVGLIDGSTIEVQGNNVRNIETPQSDHEEADSRMFIYARYLVTNNQLGQIIIASPDTDVLIIVCFHFIKSFFSCSELWFKTGNANNLRYVAVHDICKKIWYYLLHVSSCCLCIVASDSTSRFTGTGEKTAFKILQTKISELQLLYDLGDLADVQMNLDAVNDTIKFVIWLCDKTLDTNQINEICHKLFAQKNYNPENLPPTEDALIQHIKGVSYQVFIWKNAIVPMINMPSPVGNGWKKQDRCLVPNYLMKDHSTENIERTCKCTTGCRTKTCRCRKNSLGCREACLCPENTCINSKQWTSSTTCNEEYDGDCNSGYEEKDDDD